MSGKIEWKAQGNANEYALMKDGNWLAAVLMNGELSIDQQEGYVAAFSSAPELEAQRDALLEALEYAASIDTSCASDKSIALMFVVVQHKAREAIKRCQP